MGIHRWWSGFGQAVAKIDLLDFGRAREFATTVAAGIPGVAVIGFRQRADTGHSAVGIEIDVERPQDLAHSIRALSPSLSCSSPRADSQASSRFVTIFPIPRIKTGLLKADPVLSVSMTDPGRRPS